MKRRETNEMYNGWKNYETWNVALWLGNEQGSYSMMCEFAQEAYDNDEDSAVSDLAKRIEEYIDENNPLADQASVFSDLLSSALSEVDYIEIAEHYMEDVEKKEEEEEEEQGGPEEGDITTEDHRHFYQYGKLVLTVDEDEDHRKALQEYMDREKFRPNCWFISDHGNAHPMSLEEEKQQ